jgi:dTDP-4-dehydrorhamnose reductase
MKILVLGASGMIGNTVMRVLSEKNDWQVFGTIRNSSKKHFFSNSIAHRLLDSVDVENHDTLIRVIERVMPDVVINCIGLTKHKPESDDQLVSVPINTLMPHRLAVLCQLVGARLVHISTDCVFSGLKGNYNEIDFTDARDTYGKTKVLGELSYAHTITLRTSTLGYELQSDYGLLNWFLSQQQQCKGYRRAIFSGLPTVVFAKVIRDVVIPNNELSGIYHVASKPINKLDLLRLIAKQYEKIINIIPCDEFVIDRSLDASKFNKATGYVPPSWNEMIKQMYEYK